MGSREKNNKEVCEEVYQGQNVLDAPKVFSTNSPNLYTTGTY